MPVIRIDVPDDVPRETMLRIRSGVKQAVLDTLAPKETKYDYVSVCGVVAEIGDGVPLISVDLRPGREVERKKALVDAIAAILKQELNVVAEDVYVLFRETEAPDHYTGGEPLKEWVPASLLKTA
ncbi:MAG: tautomerase family protein [Pseudomonadota bacterium]